MRVLDRYLIRGFLYPFVFCVVFLCMLFVVIDVFNELDEFLKHGVAIKIILSYYLYLLPSVLVQVSPVAVLVAILYRLGNLNKNNEIIAMKASGISATQILLPYIFAGVLISFSVFMLNEVLVPKAAALSMSIKEGVIEKGKKNIKDRSIKNATLYGSEGRMIFAREFLVESNTMYDVVMFEDAPKKLHSTRTSATKAIYENDLWTLYDSIQYRYDRRGEVIDEPIYSPKLQMHIPEKPSDFLQNSSQVEFMSARKLRDYIDHFQFSSRKLVRRLSVDLHYKIAFVFTSLIVVLIGAPLAMRAGRGNALVGVGTSLVVVLLYYGINSIFLAVGKSDQSYLPPAAAAWISNGLFAGIGIFLIKRNG